MIRLSIIVPFYNVEKYIEKCIRSLYAQDIPMEEYEVICVDDCSPDGSRAIVERLQQEYPTLRLICHERNKKVGGARNTGLKAAKGRYVWFVDSDDTIYPNILGRLLDEAVADEVEILQFDYIRGEQRIKNVDLKEGVYEGESYLYTGALHLWHNKLSGAWRQLFLRQFLQDRKLDFIEDAMYEDTDYILRAILLAHRVKYVPMVAYNYRINEDSITTAPLSPIKLSWRVNLVARCVSCLSLAQADKSKAAISKMIGDSLSRLRADVNQLTFAQKMEYVRNLSSEIQTCKSFVQWRTWLAVRYGITIFV